MHCLPKRVADLSDSDTEPLPGLAAATTARTTSGKHVQDLPGLAAASKAKAKAKAQGKAEAKAHADATKAAANALKPVKPTKKTAATTRSSRSLVAAVGAGPADADAGAEPLALPALAGSENVDEIMGQASDDEVEEAEKAAEPDVEEVEVKLKKNTVLEQKKTVAQMRKDAANALKMAGTRSLRSMLTVAPTTVGAGPAAAVGAGPADAESADESEQPSEDVEEEDTTDATTGRPCATPACPRFVSDSAWKFCTACR